jgi:hypothetical protein
MQIWGSGTVTPPFLTLELEWGEWPTSCSSLFTPREIAPGTNWIGGPVWTVEKRKILPLLGIEHGHPACSQLLYWLSYPDFQYIVTCFLESQPIRRFIARRQLCEYATILQALLGSLSHITMEIQLEEVFSMWSAPRLYHASYQLPEIVLLQKQYSPVFRSWLIVTVSVPNEIQSPVVRYSELQCLSAFASEQATRKGAPVQPVEKNDRTSDCDDCNCNCKGVSQ